MPVFDYYRAPFNTHKVSVSDKTPVTCIYDKIEKQVGHDLYKPAQLFQKPSPLKSGQKLNSRSMTLGQVTPYDRILDQLDNDERWLKELTLQKRIGFYRFYGSIGYGNFSQVKLAVHQLLQERVAIKIINKRKLDLKTHRMMMREIRNMENLHHPHIIRVYEVIETPLRVHLALEYAARGELFHKITNEGRLCEQEAKLFFGQLVSAVEYMHSKNIVHRDIKAENVLLARHDSVKLADLGFSTHLLAQDQPLTTFCGSPPYAAPELFSAEHYCGPGVDAWALGVLLFFMVQGEMPFRGMSVAALKRQILDGKHGVASAASVECRRVIAGLMTRRLTDRWCLQKARQAEWLASLELPTAWPSLELAEDGTGGSLQDQVRCRLQHLGVNEQTLFTSWRQHGCRCSVGGLFRLLLHRLMRIEAGELVEIGSSVTAPAVVAKQAVSPAVSDLMTASHSRSSNTASSSNTLSQGHSSVTASTHTRSTSKGSSAKSRMCVIL